MEWPASNCFGYQCVGIGDGGYILAGDRSDRFPEIRWWPKRESGALYELVEIGLRDELEARVQALLSAGDAMNLELATQGDWTEESTLTALAAWEQAKGAGS